jgi:hypothetical protein
MFADGIAALLLQSPHPLARAAVAGHSGYRGDPWGALAADQPLPRRHHLRPDRRRPGGDRAGPGGTPADHRDRAGRDGYVAGMARIGAGLGVPDPPRTEAELTARINAYRPELAATTQARDAARFLLLHPPLPVIARAPHAVLAAAAVSLLPGWGRRQLGLPRLPVSETVLVRPAGHATVHAIRWVITAPQAPSRSVLPHAPTTRHACQGDADRRLCAGSKLVGWVPLHGADSPVRARSATRSGGPGVACQRRPRGFPHLMRSRVPATRGLSATLPACAPSEASPLAAASRAVSPPFPGASSVVPLTPPAPAARCVRPPAQG